MTRWLPELSVRRPVTIVMAFLALCVLGAIAWSRIPLEMMPGRFVLNTLWVWVPYQDSTPRENEKAILKPLEEAVSTAPGLKSMRTRARAGNTQLTLDFHRSVSMESAYNSVVDRIERTMPDLPADVDRYWIYKWNPADEPVMWSGVALSEEVEDPYHLLTDVIQKRLERVPGVGKVDVWGADARRVFIEYDLDALLTHGVSLYEVVQRLGSDNFQMASGRIVDGGKVRYVRSLARYESIDEIKQVPIKPGVVLADIANVMYRPDPDPDIAHIDGKEGAGLAINKESDANTVDVTQAVEAAFRDLEKDPRMGGARFVTFFDQGAMIQDSVGNLLSTAATGGVCAIIVLFAFLKEWRLTLLIAASMPFTLLLTVTALFFTDRTLNLLSLMGLMLAVGMVVDNAIVVVEAIYARRQAGEHRSEAAIEGTADVNMAITLSTLTTMVVFLPIILMSENADFSFFMGELGMPVIWALAASLLVALVFTPLSTTFLRDNKLPVQPRWITWLSARYQRALHWVLTHRSDALVGVLAMGFLTFFVPFQSVGCEDQADGNIGQFTVRFQVPQDFTYYERLEVMTTFEEWVDSHREEWGVRTTRSNLWSGSTNGRVYVYLNTDPEEGEMAREDVIEQAREELPQRAGVEARIGWGDSGGPPPHQIRLVMRGEDTSTLETLGGEVRRTLRGIPGILSTTPDLEDEAGQEIRLMPDREAMARYGLSAQRVGQTVSFAMRGSPLPDYHDNGKEVDVYARFQLSDRADMDRLLDFPLFSPATMSSVPLRAVVRTEVHPGFGSIHREDRTTAYPITVDLAQDITKDDAWVAVAGALQGLDLPRGYTWDRGFKERDDAENDQARNMALVLSVVLVFLIMGVLFESFLLPLSIITTIPMALFGVYWTLFFTGTSLDMMGGVGLVILVGVVVNNGIVLIDLVTRLRHEGRTRTEALVEAGGKRIRPILMTALTTIFGLLPMALGSSTFIGIPYAPLGRVVAGGLVAGTVLTLFFVPYLYSVLDDMRASSSRWISWVAGSRESSGVAK